jgi:hypothetical protein
MNSRVRPKTKVAYFDKAFVLHLNKRPHELSDQIVKERCLKPTSQPV